DQVMQCVNILSRDPESRRAVMTIFDPDKDFVDSKDIPCNIAIHWLIRDGFLNMKVFQRSSDIWWGFSGINTFEWSVLHQLMASWLNVQVGTLAYFISSLHLYERHFERAEKLLSMEHTDIYDSRPQILRTNTPIDQFDGYLSDIFKYEDFSRHGNYVAVSIPVFVDPLFKQFSLMLMLYNAYTLLPLYLGVTLDAIACIVNKMESCDLKIASLEYLYRQNIHAPGIVLPEKDRNILSLQI
ncbi:thymidylate synthase, partial [Candidatus Bathyarchaeota archaeon]|nr:thymidylate synthase [Candidatus Bathyarchaeota archaeon]